MTSYSLAESKHDYGALEPHSSARVLTLQLSREPPGRRSYIEQIYDHQGNTGQSGVPLLVIDAWEHAYYLQYENRTKGADNDDV